MSVGLLLIDIQNDYFPGGAMELHGSVEAAQVVGQTVGFFRQQHLPVIHIQHLSIKAGATFFIPNTIGAEIHERVRPLAGERVIQKHYPSTASVKPISYLA